MSQSYNISVECVADAHDDSVGSGGDGDQGKHVFVKVREARRLVLTSLYGTLMVSTNKKIDWKNYSSFRPFSLSSLCLWQCLTDGPLASFGQ